MNSIPFNKPYLTGNEVEYIKEAVERGKISGNGHFTKLCQNFFQEKFKIKKCLLTTSCTDALEMAAILADINEGDEILMPSYTFVSTANAFILRGAKIIFVDSRPDHPGMDETKIEGLITSRTKAIVPVHYAGVACDMGHIMEIATKYNLLVIEDAAQGIDSYYIDKNGRSRPLGSIGHLAAFSFHETKNIISGEGGLLAINDNNFVDRAEIIWEKGTNRSAFFRGEVDKYGWVDVGSSFLPSDIVAAFLWAQLENLSLIQNKRIEKWEFYQENLFEWCEIHGIRMPFVPSYATNNAHMFYLVCKDRKQRKKILSSLKSENILAVFHYLSLHESKFYSDKYEGEDLPFSNYYSDCLIRLPLYFELTKNDMTRICNTLKKIEL